MAFSEQCVPSILSVFGVRHLVLMESRLTQNGIGVHRALTQAGLGANAASALEVRLRSGEILLMFSDGNGGKRQKSEKGREEKAHEQNVHLKTTKLLSLRSHHTGF